MRFKLSEREDSKNLVSSIKRGGDKISSTFVDGNNFFVAANFSFILFSTSGAIHNEANIIFLLAKIKVIFILYENR